MQKKLTITVDEDVYHRLHSIVGRRKISRFIETTIRPHLIEHDLANAYREMAQEEERETEALEWAEGMVGDVADDTR